MAIFQQLQQQRCYLSDRDTIISLGVSQDIGGHPWRLRVGGIFHDNNSTTSFDGESTSGAVLEVSRQNDGDYVVAIGARGAAEQSVDCRPMTILARSHSRDGATFFNHQMPVRNCNVKFSAT